MHPAAKKISAIFHSAILWKGFSAYVGLCVQEAEAAVVQEERTVPGEDPGIYACDYKKLAQILVKTAEARIALMRQ
ncbi:hypothetical protein ABTH36_19700, partial [Acinetobacter baumannii]